MGIACAARYKQRIVALEEQQQENHKSIKELRDEKTRIESNLRNDAVNQMRLAELANEQACLAHSQSYASNALPALHSFSRCGSPSFRWPIWRHRTRCCTIDWRGPKTLSNSSAASMTPRHACTVALR